MLDSRGSIHGTVSYLIPYSELTMVRTLGEGGFATVYQAEWQCAMVAVKQLKISDAPQDALQDTQTEASVMVHLKHPNIVTLYGVCMEPPHYCIVMEYMPNGSLFSLLHSSQRTPLPWKLRYRIAMDTASGLAYLHHKGVLHRDLKSLNVLLDDSMHARLSDFGLSRIKQTSASQSLKTCSTSMRGSVHWMAPELFDRDSVFSAACDVYALGMTLWELATRRAPFEHAHSIEVIVEWVKQGGGERVPDDVPAPFAQLIRACFKPAKERPTAKEAAQTMRRLHEACRDE